MYYFTDAIKKMLGLNNTDNTDNNNIYMSRLLEYKNKFNYDTSNNPWGPLEYVINNSEHIYNSNFHNVEILAQEVLKDLHSFVLTKQGEFNWTEKVDAGVDGRDFFIQENKSAKFIEKLYYLSLYKYLGTQYMDAPDAKQEQYIRTLFDNIIPEVVGNEVKMFLDVTWLVDNKENIVNNDEKFYKIFCKELYEKYSNTLSLTDEQSGFLKKNHDLETERVQLMQEIKDLMQQIKDRAKIINDARDNDNLKLDADDDKFVCLISFTVPSNPVYLENNGIKQYYEEDELKKWLATNNTDPFSREAISEQHPVKNLDLGGLKDYLAGLQGIIDKHHLGTEESCNDSRLNRM